MTDRRKTASGRSHRARSPACLASNAVIALADGAGVRARRRAVRHLLGGCGSCSQRLAERAGLAPSEVDVEALEGALRRALEGLPDRLARQRVERGKALELLEELASEAPARARFLLGTLPRYARPALFELLIETSAAARSEGSSTYLHWAECAVALAGRLAGPEAPGRRARAWLELGDALLLSGDLARSEEALLHAASWLEAAGGDRSLRAPLLLSQGELRRRQRRFEEALELTRRAGNLFRLLADDGGFARARAQTEEIRARLRQRRARPPQVDRTAAELTS